MHVRVPAARVHPLRRASCTPAAYWPEGRGNVGYGANVGSNHTGKAPDQELWPGEGVFFGLGTSIKFPANFTRSPYSLVATGVVSLPQKMEMPFSLVNVPDRTLPELSPAFNQVFPGCAASVPLPPLPPVRAGSHARPRQLGA